MPQMEIADLRAALDRTERYIETERYRGYDPYDGLTSPVFRAPVLRSAHLPRFAFQQLLKRLPFQVRPLLGIHKGYNPVTLALVLQAYVYRDLASPDDRAARRDRIDYLVAELARLATPGWSGSCWGYDFPWETRHITMPAAYPTIVATGIVTNALFEAWRLAGSAKAGILVTGAVPFITEDLRRTTVGETFCWSYSPADHTSVLNATAKGARLCVQANRIVPNGGLLDLARATLRFVADHQAGDGGWPYSVGGVNASWRDNFHTCYVLDCLNEFSRLTGDGSFALNVQNGLDYYLRNFFHLGVVPKYYDTRLYPIDATACAQSILTLTRFGRVEQAAAVAAWCLDHMSLPDGAFRYQIYRRYENRIPYMRWSVAWLFLALSRLELMLTSGANGGTVTTVRPPSI
jgi:hypothetical protein